MVSGTIRIRESYKYKVEPRKTGGKPMIWILSIGGRWSPSNIYVDANVSKDKVEKIIGDHTHISIFKSLYRPIVL